MPSPLSRSALALEIASRLAANDVGSPRVTDLNAILQDLLASVFLSTDGVTGRVTAQNAANAAIATRTVGATDASFEVSANMNVTASTTLVTTLTVTYTDEANVSRSMILPVAALAGTMVAAGAISGAGASVWSTPRMHIRAKAGTVITILTSAGTFTGVTYTAEGNINQLA